MGKKAYIALAIAASALAAACQREPLGEAPRQRTVLFSVSPATKAGSQDEVGTLDVLLFREDGLLEAHGRASGSVVSARVAEGVTYSWHLIANAPEGLGGIAREDELLGSLSLLGDNSAARPVMAGSGQGLLDGAERTVPVDRLVSRVTLGSLEARFLADSYTESEVRLERVFLLDAAGSCPYSRVPSRGELSYNARSLDPDLPEGVASLLVRECGQSLSAEPLQEDISLLCCPDPDGRTRLVALLSIDGEPNYYSVELPSMRCNTEYLVRSLVLLGPGSPTPDTPVSREDVAFTVEVAPWGTLESSATFD